MYYHTRDRDIDQPAVRAIRDALKGTKTVYIVGKGPSLDDLIEKDFEEFPNAPIICINESVHTIEKLSIPSERLFCMQHDDLTHINRPKRATWMLSTFGWNDQQGDYSKDIQYKKEDITKSEPNLTVCTAMSAAALAGANQIVLLAFDAAFSGDCNYASSINRSPHRDDQDDNRFISFSEISIPNRAKEEGLNLIWQSPKNFWYIGLVLRCGPEYSMRHVELIKEQIDKQLTNPHQIVLFTDKWDAHSWFKVPLKTLWPGPFAKLELFDPSINLRGGMFYTDIDHFFGKPFTLPRWDSLEPGVLYAHRDVYRPMWSSALMAWRLPTVTEPYTYFMERPVTHHPDVKVFGDQEVVTDALKYRIKDLSFVRAKSWKAHKPDPTKVDCVLFHGNPKPWDVGLVTL